jgi:hypothetical protein
MATEDSLGERLAAVGQQLGEREKAHAAALDAARGKAAELRERVAGGLAAYQQAIEAAGAGQLRVQLGELRPDEKHIRAVEFDLIRGRNRAIITVKRGGEVTLVGPFHRGKTEGPCKTFPFEAEEEIQQALGDFLEHFLEAAAAP